MDDQTKYRNSSAGAIVMANASSNNRQSGCSVVTEAAEVMDQMAGPPA